MTEKKLKKFKFTMAYEGLWYRDYFIEAKSLKEAEKIKDNTDINDLEQSDQYDHDVKDTEEFDLEEVTEEEE